MYKVCIKYFLCEYNWEPIVSLITRKEGNILFDWSKIGRNFYQIEIEKLVLRHEKC